MRKNYVPPKMIGDRTLFLESVLLNGSDTTMDATTMGQETVTVDTYQNAEWGSYMEP